MVAHDLLPEFGKLAVEEITVDRVDAWRARQVASGLLADRTINKQLVLLHGIFKRAMRVHGLAVNPAAGVDRQPKRDSGDFDVLSPAEISALARAAGGQDAAIFTVAAFTGLRQGELLELRWGDVDFAKHLVHVRRSWTHGAMGPPKSGRVRSVPLIDQAAAALDGLSRRESFTTDSDLVFCTDAGGHLDHDQLRRRLYGALELAGLRRVRFHDLRHTFGTLAVQAFPLSDVKAFMGHADISTTMIYVHHVPQIDAADRLSRLIADADPLVIAEPSSVT